MGDLAALSAGEDIRSHILQGWNDVAHGDFVGVEILTQPVDQRPLVGPANARVPEGSVTRRDRDGASGQGTANE